MKLIISIVVFILIASLNLNSQTLQPDYSKLPSRVTPSPMYNPSPLGTTSNVVTSADGYDNFFLGTDFGEPHIAINPNDPLNMATAFNISTGYYVCLNGLDWTKIAVSFPSNSAIGDPVLSYDSLGNLYYLQLYQMGSLYGGWVAKSTNKGQSFQTAVSAYSFNNGLGDKPWIICDQTAGPYSNNIYIGWRQFGSTGMRFVRSTDGGQTFSSPISFTGDQGAYVSVGASSTTSGGCVYMGCIYSNSIRVYKSTDGGASFGSAVTAVNGIQGPGTICAGRFTVKNCIRTDYFPRMAADNSFTSTRGNVYVTFAGNPGTSDKADIYFSRSTDYGATWSVQTRVNDDATTTDQWMPCITVDKKTGRIYMMWFDSRNDPSGNLLTEMWGTYSTNGGVSFVPNYKISNSQFNPNSMAVGQPGGENYIGDYIGNSSVTGTTSMNSFMDARNSSLGSYTAYSPDFAMQTRVSQASLNNNDSISASVVIPSVRGGFNERVKITFSLDTLPSSGSIQFSFANGKDSITTFPDSVIFKVKTVGNVTPRIYKLNILANAKSIIPVHRRTMNLIVNSSYLNIGTNRESICDFTVNGTSYNSRQNLLIPNGTAISIRAISPKITGNTKYIYRNWSDAGDTIHTVNVNSNVTVTANYGIAFKLLLNSSIGNTFGGNLFYDSAVTFQFGTTGKIVSYNGLIYRFRGWTGSGNGSYTSADSTGNDTTVSIAIHNVISETTRWQQIVGINNISSEIPDAFKLYQNYPNPFNPVTNINFDVAQAGKVRIAVYDILGKEIDVLANDILQAGRYRAVFSADKLASGIYFYRLEVTGFTDIKRMIVLK
ncbi:MAG: T9SS type A sorting domain-containing protein [Ignavibacteria bacterium]|nr:T9SS type A sorting domain-containing protein [Ignavibacteria bacterium]